MMLVYSTMIVNILYWYIILSYVTGIILFFAELPSMLRSKSPNVVAISLIATLFSPLISWHGVLHYAQRWYCKLTGRPVKYWI